MKKRGQIRIIGGQWRSRRLRVAAAPGLRPSADAVRETVFNWLPMLRDKTCLDLFAGSGAFGFEAASRGAVKVVMVEPNRAALDALRVSRDLLRAARVEIFPGYAEKFLRGRRGGFDIVFLDPPFADAGKLLSMTFERLRAREFLNPRALIYVESPPACSARPLPIPRDWHIIREKRCGAAQSTLIQT